jgi:hypothetical protein
MLFLYGFLLGASSAWLALLVKYCLAKRSLMNRVSEARKLIDEENARIQSENDRIIEKIERLNLARGDKNESTIN